MFYREQATGFGRDASLCDEGRFEALVRMFCQALKTIDTLPQTQRPAVLARLNAVRQVSHNFGHGMDESIDSVLEGHGGCG